MNKPDFNPNQKNTVIATGNNAPSSPASQDKKKIDPKVVVGAGLGAAVLGGGVAAAAHAMNNSDSDDEIDLDANAEEIVIGEDSDFNPDAPIGLGSIFSHTDSTTESHTSTSHTSSHTSAAQTSAPHNSQQGNSSQSQQHQQQQSHQQHQQVTNEQTDDQKPPVEDIDEQPIDADEIIALTEVDADDNDIPELLSFESVELVPDEDGGVQIQAQFTMEGENYTMIDVDNDGVFDSVADAAGNNQGGAAGMMLSDIELINNENNSDYLAANDYDNNSDVSATGESAVDDTIIV